MTLLGKLHGRFVFGRRIQRLCRALAQAIPQNIKLIDVGCGDGSLDLLLLQQRPDLRVEGIDVLVREKTAVPVTPFDGEHIPYADDSFDAALFVDVLHHTADPAALLAEAARVSRRWIIIKDHNQDGWLARQRLTFMDYVGNAHFGVALPNNYWSRARWQQEWAQRGLNVAMMQEDLGLYPWPADLMFGQGLHFVAVLEIVRKPTGVRA